MGTRSIVTVILKEEDLGKKIVFNPTMIEYPYIGIHGEQIKIKLTPSIETPMNVGCGVRCYIQFDGYPSGVGKELVEHYNTYEKALNLAVGGPLECICTTLEKGGAYHGGYCPCKELDINSTRPKIRIVFRPEEYNWQYDDSAWEYLFQNGKWYAKNYDDYKNWTEVEKILEK